MANRNEKFQENAPGSWYVDKSCIVCGLCSEVAPTIFKTTADFDHNYVYHQPDNSTERGLAKEAMESCPAEAIGCDDSAEMPLSAGDKNLDT